MGLYKQLPDHLAEVDIIIAGGGTAGCIVAGRLAAADPNLTILVIEWGRDNHNDPLVVNPAFWKFLFPPAAKSSIFYMGNKAPQLADRVPIVPAGGLLGGGSSINVQMYTRAQRSDFDSWNTPGWSTEDLIPYLKKLETYHGPGSPSVHGYNGPVHISDGGFRSKIIMDDMLQAASSLGYPEIVDLQDLDSNNGYQRWLRNNSPEGKRQDTAHTYLHPLLQDGNHPNLHVLVEHKVVRVILDDDENQAKGVEFIPNPDFITEIPAPAPGIPRKVTARKIIILSAGACGTPGILERSGVGNPEILTKAGVEKVRVDLAGVGHDYQDHHLTVATYKTCLGEEDTPDKLYAGVVTPEALIEQENPMRRWNAVDIAAKIRPTEEEVSALGEEFEKAWERDFKGNENKPMMLSAVLAGLVNIPSTSVPEGRYLSIVNYTAYPYSRGYIHITSAAEDMTAPLDFNVGFFTDEKDLDIKKLVWAYKKTREVMRRTKLYRGEVAAGHPEFPEGSQAACLDLPVDKSLAEHLRTQKQGLEMNGKMNGHAVHPGPNGSANTVTERSQEEIIQIQNLVYSKEDDEAIEEWLRKTVATTWHSLGTCKMAPREKKGVVDDKLNVYGTRGLKIVDLSIVPENVGGNTCNTAMMIGERGADIIAKEVLGRELSFKGELV
ncbi:GMC oxidoreductase-domain-containing protein [Rhypophila decipiens]|uniref:GMC oxidoreductase-domain-containing protein n=1 Tax=Rhypophila decipiens TaxID=261697 RepID=A0AAN6Y3D3_9PEZI|nr:GMC oxidoreductase-domain-containing protein [Rhypophila decipiens]